MVASPRDVRNVPASVYDRIEVGREVSVTMFDGIVHKGGFGGMGFACADAYSGRYRHSVAIRLVDTLLPLPGETVTIRMRRGETGDYVFVGFDQRHARVIHPDSRRPMETTKYVIVIEDSSDSAQRSVSVEDITSVSNSRVNPIGGTGLSFLLSAIPIPLLSEMTLQNSTGIRRLPVDQIEQVEASQRSPGMTPGIVVGAIIDAGLLAWLIAEIAVHGVY